MKRKTEKAASQAAKKIKKLKKPTRRKIAEIYKQFQSVVEEYGHMP